MRHILLTCSSAHLNSRNSAEILLTFSIKGPYTKLLDPFDVQEVPHLEEYFHKGLDVYHHHAIYLYEKLQKKVAPYAFCL